MVKTGLDLGEGAKGGKIQSLEMGVEKKVVLVFHNESSGATNC